MAIIKQEKHILLATNDKSSIMTILKDPRVCLHNLWAIATLECGGSQKEQNKR